MEALAVKYRPKVLKEVVGQDEAKKVIGNFLNKKKLPNAFLITGPTGVGKTTLSRIIARTINCTDGTGCGECDSCRVFDADPDSHPDFHEQNAASARGIDDVRYMIEQSNFRPRFHTRVMLLDEVHQLTTQAINALLKSLEEPADDTTWILATTNPEKLPRTITNRCVAIKVGNIDLQDLARRLFSIAKREGHKIKGSTAMKIAEYAGGGGRDAISKLEVFLNLLEAGSKESDKTVEKAFQQSEDMDSILAAQGILISAYEGSTFQMIQLIGEASKSLEVLMQKLPMMNGYLLYSIIRMQVKDAKNPYFFSYDNKALMDVMRPELRDRKKQAEVFKRAKQMTTNIQNFRNAMMSAGVYDAVGIAIMHLTKDIVPYPKKGDSDA